MATRFNPYNRPAPKPAPGQCSGCNGGLVFWNPKAGAHAGKTMITCALPWEQRTDVCKQNTHEANMQTGAPPQMVVDGGYQGGWQSVNHQGQPLAPPPPADGLEEVQKALALMLKRDENLQRTIDVLSQNVGALSEIVTRLTQQ